MFFNLLLYNSQDIVCRCCSLTLHCSNATANEPDFSYELGTYHIRIRSNLYVDEHTRGYKDTVLIKATNKVVIILFIVIILVLISFIH